MSERTKITDGAGNDYAAKVNSDNQLSVILEPATTTNYKVLRVVSTVDDTGLAAGEALWSNAKVVNSRVKLDYTGNKTIGMVHIRIRGIDADNETGHWCLYACKGLGEAPEFVAYGTFILGVTVAGVIGALTEYWADTIVVTEQDWLKTVSIVNGNQYNLGTGSIDGGIAKIVFDSCEYQYLVMFMSKNSCAGSGCDVSNFA